MKITSWLGIHNTNPARSIPDNALADAVDVFLDDVGALLRRQGCALAKSLPISSAYETADNAAYLVSDGVLYAIEPELFLTAIAPCQATEFCDVGRYLFTNDGLQVFQGDVVDLRLPAPIAPQVSITPGNLPAGKYSILTTQVDGNGRMSGTSPIMSVVLTSPAGISVIPNVLDGCTGKVWMTDAFPVENDAKVGGEVFYEYTGGTGHSEGAILPDVFIGADSFQTTFSPWRQIEWFDSRLYVSAFFQDHTVIWYSQRHHYHLYDLSSGFFVVPGRVLAIKATRSAMAVVTTSEIYAYDGQNLTKLADYGCPAGRSITKIPDQDALLIHSKRGVCSFPAFQNLTDKMVSLPAGQHCSSHIIHLDGVRQFIALHDESVNFNPYTY